MKKILFLLFLLCFIGKVNAVDVNDSFYYDDERVSDMWITREKGDNSASGNPYILKRVSDNKYVYCLEPFAMLSKYENYEGFYSNNEKFNLDDDVIDKINLYAYYGYQYPGHEDIKWYGITQYLIWKTIEPSADIYFTDARFGNRLEGVYVSEISELELMVNNHNVLPSFVNDTHKYSYQTDITLTDNNNILDNYDIVDSNGLVIDKKGNKLSFNVNEVGEYQLHLKQKQLRECNNEWILYYHSSGQDVMLPGKISFNQVDININIIDGMITLQKKDSDNKHYDNTTLSGAKYGIYDGDNLVDIITTGDDGIGYSKRLPIKKYTIKELSPSIGYELDVNAYNIELTIDNPNQTLMVSENVIRNDITINKKYGNSKVNLYYAEIGAIFEVYNEQNKLIANITTDSKGQANINLPYGKYRFHQVSGKNHFTLVDDFWITVDQGSQKQQSIHLVNEEKEQKGKLEILKYGENNQLLANVKFHIYAAEDIVSPLGIIYYHKGDLVTDLITDDLGYASIFLYPGKYLIQEYETNSGYILDNSSKDIIIEDNKTITIKLENYKEVIEVPDTYQKEYNSMFAMILVLWGIGLLIHAQKVN